MASSNEHQHPTPLCTSHVADAQRSPDTIKFVNTHPDLSSQSQNLELAPPLAHSRFTSAAEPLSQSSHNHIISLRSSTTHPISWSKLIHQRHNRTCNHEPEANRPHRSMCTISCRPILPNSSLYTMFRLSHHIRMW